MACKFCTHRPEEGRTCMGTETPKADGTYEWDSTIIGIVEGSPGKAGFGCNMAPSSRTTLILKHADARKLAM
ncbi:MAG TPA: hypothetical protein VFA51_03085 [Candidatus Udaeobacter sp.]|nr:hypothetical protein [Candidatus Udaeobacter sp.]